MSKILGPDGEPIKVEQKGDPPTINWRCYEESGGPLYHVPDPSVITNVDQIFVREHWVTTKEGLREGMLIVVETLFGPTEATIQRDEYGEFHALTGDSLMHVLKWRDDYQWGDDKVACWTCVGSCNLAGLDRLYIAGGDDDG